jgi:Putative peptidoglycan binding domain
MLPALFLVPAAPASAATPTCWGHNNIWPAFGNQNWFIDLPAYEDSGSTVCLLSTSSASWSGTTSLQATLIQCYGYLPVGSVDGLYGPKTKAAVIKVQARYGLAQDGVYGPNTARAMSWGIEGANSQAGKTFGCRNAAQYVK